MSPISSGTISRGRPRADAVADLDARVLDVATAAFLAQGYSATSIGQIIREAKVSSKTVYARYVGKAELFLAVVERLLAPTRLNLARSLSEIDRDLLSGLLAIAMAGARHWTSSIEIGLYRLLIAEGNRFPELVEIYRRSTEPSHQILIDLLSTAASRQDLAITDAQEAARIFYGMTYTYVRDEALLGNQLSDAEVAQHVETGVRLFLRLYDPKTVASTKKI